MDVIVHGTTGVPTRVRTAALRKLGRLERVAHDVSRAEVRFSEERNPRIAARHRCAVVVHRRRRSVTGHAAAADPVVALDQAVEKVRHQVSRRKEGR